MRKTYARVLTGEQALEDRENYEMELNELDSTCGVSDDELTKRFVEAIRIDNEIKKIKGIPIQKYDNEKKQPYLEYPDGRREYV